MKKQIEKLKSTIIIQYMNKKLNYLYLKYIFGFPLVFVVTDLMY